MIRPIVIIGGLIVLALVLAGCLSSPMNGDSALGFGQTSGASQENYEGASSYPGAPTLARTPPPAYTSDVATDQKIIRTAGIRLEVANVTTALDHLGVIAKAHEGYTGSVSVNTRYGNQLYAELTMKVPAKTFEDAISDVKKLGTLKSESLNADDITEEYVDLQARRTALASQLTQYNRIMEQAENVSEILEVQTQIERVQVEIDRIDGRLKYLDNRVDYATITVSLEEPEPVGGGEQFSFISVINEGVAGFLIVAAGLVIIIISLIPIIILIAVIYLVYRWWKRRSGGIKKGPETKAKGDEDNPQVR